MCFICRTERQYRQKHKFKWQFVLAYLKMREIYIHVYEFQFCFPQKNQVLLFIMLSGLP